MTRSYLSYLCRFNASRLLLLLLLTVGLVPGEARAAAGPTLTVSDANGTSGSQVLVTVKVTGFVNISTFQFSFHWNPSHAAFVNVEQLTLPGLAGANFGTTHTNDGILNVSWDDLGGGGQSLSDGTTLFAARLVLVGANGSASDVVIDSSSTPIEISNSDGQIVTPTLIAGHLVIGQFNTAPVLAPIGNKTVNEGTLLTFTNSATDGDVPAQTLTYSLTGAPTGASINAATGVFLWTPTEAQGPSNYTFSVVVTDNGSPALIDLKSVTVTVNEVNVAPVLASIGNKTVNEGVLLTFTASATDSDLPAQTLTFSMTGAPSGASLNTNSGVFTWAPTSAQGPNTYTLTIRVTDNGSPALNDSETITITVNEINTAPVLASIGNKTVNEGSLLTFTNSATDSDLPAQTLTYSLVSAPSGANINASSGVFIWTPTEAQGPSNYVFTIRVTDNGSPALNDAETITVTVNEVNVAPVLSPIGNKTVNEGALLTFTNSATDADLPAQTLAYSLTGAPNGAAINPSTGIFTWTPSESQGGTSYTLTVRVTDNGSPAMNDSETITITVNEFNNAPVLSPISNKTVIEGRLLAFTNSATDSDLPAQSLTYSLAGAPAGATINPVTGVFAWVPPENPAPVPNVISVIVADNGSPSLSATQTFTVTVIKTNGAPVLAPLGNFLAQVLLPLKVTNVVTDPDLPTNLVTFGIVDAPKGVRINRFTGVAIWVPARNQARSTNLVTVYATDDGLPPLSATNSFQVVVDDYLELALSRTVVRAGQTGSVFLTVTNTTGVTNISSLLLLPAEHLTNVTLSGFAPEVSSGTLTPQGPGLTKLSLAAAAGQTLQPAQQLAQLNFTALATQSMFVPLLLSNVTTIQSNGVPLSRTIATSGRVVIVGKEPLLEALPTTNTQSMLVLYGQTGSNYVVQSTSIPVGPNNVWQLVWQGTMTNLFQPIQPPITNNPLLFYRSIRQ